jgi:hypothetical protein
MAEQVERIVDFVVVVDYDEVWNTWPKESYFNVRVKRRPVK